MEQLRKFAKYFKPYKWTILAGILCILVSMAFGLLVPYFGRPWRSMIWRSSSTWEKIIYYPLVILGVNAGERHLSFSAAALLDQHVAAYRVRHAAGFLRALVDQPLEYFHETRVSAT